MPATHVAFIPAIHVSSVFSSRSPRECPLKPSFTTSCPTILTVNTHMLYVTMVIHIGWNVYKLKLQLQQTRDRYNLQATLEPICDRSNEEGLLFHCAHCLFAQRTSTSVLVVVALRLLHRKHCITLASTSDQLFPYEEDPTKSPKRDTETLQLWK
jgi:hypothetical protein